MPFTPDNLGLSETGLPLLRDLIHERTGLFYDNGRYDMLSDRLAPLVLERGFASFLDFYYLLKYDDRSANLEWNAVMDALSVQETYFWRESDQLEALARHVMPELQAAAHGWPIRIWSVPCATGEEPLSIAIVLNEHGWFRRAEIEIHASDGSAAAIGKAKLARYRERSFRALPDTLRDKYFERHPDGSSSPIPELAGRISSWSIVNLMSKDEAQWYARAPVIFCRNVFIYFSAEGVRQVTAMFADSMPTPGFLFVGASESLLSATDRFTLEEHDKTFVYVKR